MCGSCIAPDIRVVHAGQCAEPCACRLLPLAAACSSSSLTAFQAWSCWQSCIGMLVSQNCKAAAGTLVCLLTPAVLHVDLPSEAASCAEELQMRCKARGIPVRPCLHELCSKGVQESLKGHSRNFCSDWQTPHAEPLLAEADSLGQPGSC